MNHFSRYFGFHRPVLIYCEDFVNKVLGAVVVCRIISANWNEFIRPRLLLKTLPCHEKFLQDVFIPAVRVLVDNVVLWWCCVKVHCWCSSRQRKIKTGLAVPGKTENILINHPDPLGKYCLTFTVYRGGKKNKRTNQPDLVK